MNEYLSCNVWSNAMNKCIQVKRRINENGKIVVELPHVSILLYNLINWHQLFLTLIMNSPLTSFTMLECTQCDKGISLRFTHSVTFMNYKSSALQSTHDLFMTKQTARILFSEIKTFLWMNRISWEEWRYLSLVFVEAVLNSCHFHQTDRDFRQNYFELSICTKFFIKLLTSVYLGM